LSVWAQPAASARQASASATYDIPSFTAELNRLSVALRRSPSSEELASIRDALPKQWFVTTPERTYSVSTDPLREELTSSSLNDARAWLDHLAVEAQSYSNLRMADPQIAQTELTRILAQSEFAAVRRPSAWDLLRKRVEAWLARLIFKILDSISRYPIGGMILFWIIVTGGVSLIALWVFRFLISRDRMDVLPAGGPLIPSRTWQEWVRLAREAANRQDYREAVHAAYWAGIVRLEGTGILPLDRTRTPREYLRLLDEPTSHEFAPRTALHEPLAGLTNRLERTWYANRGAGLVDFRESLKQLEALGCPLE
jgi:hypothetical protein